jgi:hypothetical protein
VKKNVSVTISQAASHGTSSSSTRIRMSSGMARVGWVSLSWMAASNNKSSSEGGEVDNQLTFGQSSEWFVEALEPPDDIGQTSSRPEVLLLQTQLFTDCKCAWGR